MIFSHHWSVVVSMVPKTGKIRLWGSLQIRAVAHFKIAGKMMTRIEWAIESNQESKLAVVKKVKNIKSILNKNLKFQKIF